MFFCLTREFEREMNDEREGMERMIECHEMRI